MHYYGPMMDGNDWGWGWLMILLWLLIFVVIAVVAVRLFNTADERVGKADPLSIAKERYARGEITKEQYEQLRRDLK